jgi:hypothetical protein
MTGPIQSRRSSVMFIQHQEPHPGRPISTIPGESKESRFSREVLIRVDSETPLKKTATFKGDGVRLAARHQRRRVRAGSSLNSRLGIVLRPMAGSPQYRASPTAWRFGGSGRTVPYRMLTYTKVGVGSGTSLRLQVVLRLRSSVRKGCFRFAVESTCTLSNGRCEIYHTVGKIKTSWALIFCYRLSKFASNK